MTRWHAAPVFGVRNVRATAEYYRDVLGFTLDPDDGVFQPSPDEPGGVYGIVERDGVAVHFQIRRDDPPPPPRARGGFERDLYVYVSALDTLHADLTQRGATILQPPHRAPHGIREMVVEDCNGLRLAFGERG